MAILWPLPRIIAGETQKTGVVVWGFLSFDIQPPRVVSAPGAVGPILQAHIRLKPLFQRVTCPQDDGRREEDWDTFTGIFDRLRANAQSSADEARVSERAVGCVGAACSGVAVTGQQDTIIERAVAVITTRA